MESFWANTELSWGKFKLHLQSLKNLKRKIKGNYYNFKQVEIKMQLIINLILGFTDDSKVRHEEMFDMSFKKVGVALVINPASTSNSGKYTCTAQSEKGTTSKTVSVKVV